MPIPLPLTNDIICEWPLTDDYFLPEDLSIQQRQQEDFSHGTPIASGVPAYISATGGSTAKANPPKVIFYNDTTRNRSSCS